MSAFSLDSNCIIAAVCGWHEHHAAAAAAIEERLGGGDRLVVAAHAKADVLITFNARHFEPAPKGMTIIEPRLV